VAGLASFLGLLGTEPATTAASATELRMSPCDTSALYDMPTLHKTWVFRHAILTSRKLHKCLTACVNHMTL
jgi:hypothetical protein